MDPQDLERLLTLISVIALFFAWAAGYSKGGQR